MDCSHLRLHLPAPHFSSPRKSPAPVIHFSFCQSPLRSLDCIAPFSSFSAPHRTAQPHRFRRLILKAKPPVTPSILDYNEEDYELSEEVETEEEAKRRNWVERDWAPWEELLSPEAQFAVDSLQQQGEAEPIVSHETFQKLNIKRTLLEEGNEEEDKNGAEEDDNGALQSQETMVFALIPPRDWPPPGWKVDPNELAFIREAHLLESVRITSKDMEKATPLGEGGSFDRWKMFMKQYEEWVAANKDRLDREELELDEEYYPGRRRTGRNYRKGMYELPFIYPGQHYWGEVTCVSLYEGAFVYFGGVHDGWVPIKGNDWYWIRNHIKVGTRVQVEVLAKRDPYRFRFPVEMRFVNPNIDSLIFKRFKSPPIFVRAEDTNLDEVARDSDRPYWPKRRPETVDGEEDRAILNHPHIFKVWQMHMAEQMILDAEENNLAGIEILENLDEGDIERHDSNEDAYWIKDCPLGDTTVPKLVLTQDEKELDIEAARTERKAINVQAEEARSRGEKFQRPKLNRELYIEELNAMHRQRYIEESEALERDKSCRMEFGLPLEEPGRYADASFFRKNPYDPREKRWRHDYFGDPTKSKEDIKKEKESRSQAPEIVVEEEEEDDLSTWGRTGKDLPRVGASKDEDEQSPAGNTTTSRELGSSTGDKVVNGTESLRVLDIKGMFNNRDEWKKDDGKDDSDEA